MTRYRDSILPDAAVSTTEVWYSYRTIHRGVVTAERKAAGDMTSGTIAGCMEMLRKTTKTVRILGLAA